MRFISTRTSGCASLKFNMGVRLCPPAKILAPISLGTEHAERLIHGARSYVLKCRRFHFSALLRCLPLPPPNSTNFVGVRIASAPARKANTHFAKTRQNPVRSDVAASFI